MREARYANYSDIKNDQPTITSDTKHVAVFTGIICTLLFANLGLQKAVCKLCGYFAEKPEMMCKRWRRRIYKEKLEYDSTT